MKIEEGKTYRTRDGKKAEVFKIVKTLFDSLLLAYYKTEEGNEGVVYALSGRGNHEDGPDHPSDLIAEWQDEPKKEISDMSEVKFKVGDRVKSVSSEDYDKNWDNVIIHQIDEDGTTYCIWGRQNGVGDVGLFNKYMIELIPSTPEPNTKWVFNDGQDFVVRVVGFNDKGQIVLETLADEGSYELGEYFSFEGGNENFGNFYKPWVEKAEKQKIVGYVTVVKEIGTGRLDFDGSVFDTEQEARDSFDSWTGAWELVDVVKVEWEES